MIVILTRLQLSGLETVSSSNFDSEQCRLGIDFLPHLDRGNERAILEARLDNLEITWDV